MRRNGTAYNRLLYSDYTWVEREFLNSVSWKLPGILYQETCAFQSCCLLNAAPRDYIHCTCIASCTGDPTTTADHSLPQFAQLSLRACRSPQEYLECVLRCDELPEKHGGYGVVCLLWTVLQCVFTSLQCSNEECVFTCLWHFVTPAHPQVKYSLYSATNESLTQSWYLPTYTCRKERNSK